MDLAAEMAAEVEVVVAVAEAVAVQLPRPAEATILLTTHRLMTNRLKAMCSHPQCLPLNPPSPPISAYLEHDTQLSQSYLLPSQSRKSFDQPLIHLDNPVHHSIL